MCDSISHQVMIINVRHEKVQIGFQVVVNADADSFLESVSRSLEERHLLTAMILTMILTATTASKKLNTISH